MGRSKKTWDHLVDRQGNYGIDIKNGIWPGSGQAPSVKGEPGQKGAAGSGSAGGTGATGQKGSEGQQGQKGERGRTGFSLKGGKGDTVVGPKGEPGDTGEKGEGGIQGEQGPKGDATDLLHFQGQVPTVPELPIDDGNQPGDVWQIVADDTFWVWDGSQWVKLSEALSVLKGEKGQEGPVGEKGVDAKGIDGIDGTDGTDGQDGDKGEVGDEGEKGEEGDKGETGDKGEIGASNYDLYFDSTLDNPKLSEPEYLESLKGQKGDSGIDNSVLADYYDQDEVNYLLQQYPDPPDAYDINHMDDNSVILPPGLVNFNTTDQNDRLYNKGLVTILPGCTIENSPAPNTPLLVINWVMADPTETRGVEYTLIQFLFNADDASIVEGGYFRRCTPGLNRFSPWSSVGMGQGDMDNFYTKGEADDRFAKAPHIDPNFALFTEASEHYLRLFTQGNTISSIASLGQVKLVEGPGIKVENVDGELKLSATSEPLYLGTLEFDEDPQVEFDTRPEHAQKTLQNGNFFIYSSEGFTVNVEPPGSVALSSDFCVYNETADTWNVIKRESSGIQTLTTEPHGRLGDFDTLEIDNSDPKSLSIKTTDQVVVQRQLLSHPRWGPLVELESRRKIGSLADVDLQYKIDNPGLNSPAEYGNWMDFQGVPSQGGEISIDIESGVLSIARIGNAGTDNTWLADGFDTLGYFLQVQLDGFATVVTSVYSVGKNANRFEFVLGKDSAAMVAACTAVTLKASAGQATETAKISRVVPTAENGDLLIYNSATRLWEAAPVTQIGDFVRKDGDEMAEGAVHCWPGPELFDTEMCISYGKIDATGSYTLSNRAGLQVELTGGGGSRPLALTTGHGTGTMLGIYSYDSSETDERGRRYAIDANGSVYSNGSLWMDLSSATQHPAAGLALRMDIDGTTRINYNSSNDELTLAKSLLRINFTGNETANPLEVRVGTDIVAQMAKGGEVTLNKRLDINMGAVDPAGLRLVGKFAVKSSDNITVDENSLDVGHNYFQVTANSSFNRLSAGDDTITFKILGKKPGSNNIDDEILTVYQDSVKANGDSVNYYGRMNQNSNIVTKKFVDDTVNFYSYPELV